MKRRIWFPRIRKRIDNLKHRIAAKALLMMYPEFFADPVKEIGNFLKSLIP